MGLVYVNGTLCEPDAAALSIFDHGLVVGDGVFETVLITNARPFALSRHLERLERSAKGLGIAAPEREVFEQATAEVVAASGLTRGRLRITLTAGRGALGSSRSGAAASLVVAAEALPAAKPTARVAVVPWTRNERGALVGLKTTSYAENALALAEAERRGADEAIFGNTMGQLCEGTGSNVFVVRDGVLATPRLSSGCLAGVTRALVLERHGALEEDLPLVTFAAGALEEAFLTSTLRGVQPISAIDAHELPCPGPITVAVAAVYDRLVEEGLD